MSRFALLVVALAGCDQVFDLTRPPSDARLEDAPIDDVVDAAPLVCDLDRGSTPIPIPSKGSGIITGRFDNDDSVDLAVGSTGASSIRIFHNNGTGMFSATPTEIVVGAPILALAGGDLNQDSFDDVVAVTQMNTHVLLQTASSWDPRTAGLIGGASSSVAVANFDGTGLADLLVTHPSGMMMQLVLGGLTGYARGGSVPTTGVVIDAVAADVDGDQDLDLVGVLENRDGVAMYMDTGPSFEESAPIGTGSKPKAVAVGAFGTRTVLDMVVANHDTNDLTVLRNNGGGAFAAESNLAVEQAPMAVVIADVTRDNKADVLVANNKSNSFTLLRGTDTGFELGVSYTTVAKPIALAVADFTGDGFLDVAVLGEDDGFVIHPTVCAPP